MVISQKKICIERSQGFDDGSGRVCLLERCINGLEKSGCEWSWTFSNFLKLVAFNICSKELCLFVTEGIITFVSVDDIVMLSGDQEQGDAFKSQSFRI
jgi:hypothetical protein